MDISAQPAAMQQIDYTAPWFVGLHKTFPVLTLEVKKRCTKCGVERPLEDYSPNARNTTYGVASYCKKCNAIKANQRRADNPQRFKEIRSRFADRNSKKAVPAGVVSKVCLGCLADKPLETFSFLKTGKFGRKTRCKECLNNEGNVRKEANIAQIANLSKKVSKRCSRCEVEQPLEQFGVWLRAKDGRISMCKKCVSIDNKNRYPQKRDFMVAYRKKNRKALLAYSKDYNSKTKPRRNKKRRARYHSDPAFRIETIARSRVRRLLCGERKEASTMKLVGVDRNGWASYLEGLFWPGMSMSNDGAMLWEVDHIVPVCSFDRSDPNWQFKAFHYTNTQPLWEDDNNVKRDRLDWTPAESDHELPKRLADFVPLQKKERT